MARLTRAFRWTAGVLVLAVFAAVLWLATRPPPLTVQGEVSADRVDISPRVAGRIKTLGADVGDTVERGAVLTELDNPQLAATLLAAIAVGGDSLQLDSALPAASVNVLMALVLLGMFGWGARKKQAVAT